MLLKIYNISGVVDNILIFVCVTGAFFFRLVNGFPYDTMFNNPTAQLFLLSISSSSLFLFHINWTSRRFLIVISYINSENVIKISPP